MNKPDTLRLLSQHTTEFEEEGFFRQITLDFVEKTELFWSRSNLDGHLTGSAWILNPDKNKTLLIHHKTLDKWFQPGGHTEPGDLDIWETARREAEEETGIENLTNLSASIFDLDVHIIPEKGELPAHFHYDVRFAFLAESEVLPPTNSEVSGLAWVSLDALLRQLDTQQSIRRMAIKSLLLSAF